MGVLARFRRSSAQDDEPEWIIIREGRALLVRAIFAICTALVSSIATTPMTAQVQLPSVNLGDTNFEDGFAGPGLLLEEFPDVYSAGTFKDSKGATVPGTNTLTAIASTSHVAYISNKRLFGAWIGAEFLVPIVDVEVKLANGTNATVRGEADPVLGPFALQWAPRQVGHGVFVQRAILDLTAPIGKYSDQRPVNIGNHFVTINPYSVLKTDRHHGAETLHQSGNGRSGLRHSNENLARLAIGVKADREIAFMSPEGEVMRDGRTLILYTRAPAGTMILSPMA